MLNTYLKNGSNKKYLVAFFVLLILFLTERFFHEQIRLKLEKVVFTEIQKINNENKIGYVDYYYFPPKIIFKNASLSTKDDSYSVDAKSGFVSLKLFALVSGKVKIKETSLNNAKANLDIKINPKKEKEDLDINLDLILKTLPMDYITIKNTELDIKYEDTNYLVKLSRAELKRTDSKIWLNLKSENKITTKTRSFVFKVDSDLNWGSKGIFVTAFRLFKDQSQVSLTGLFNEAIIKDIETGLNPINNTYEVRSSSILRLEDLRELIFLLPRKTQQKLSFLEDSSGELKIKGNLLSENNLDESREGRLKIVAKDIKTAFTDLKQLSFSSSIKDSTLSSDDFLVVFDERSRLSLKTLNLKKTSSGTKVDLETDSKYIELRQVLKSINVDASNLSIPFSIRGKCSGKINGDESLIKCRNKGRLLSAKIATPNGNGAIIDINSAKYDLETFLTSRDIKLQVEASRQDSTASASGIIDFNKGFNIDFNAPKVSYTNFVNEIASSSLNGEGDLTGNVSGTSRTAKFDIKTKNTDIEFNDFFLGRASISVSYLYPKVKLENVEGKIDSSLYSGDIIFNVDKDTLDIAVESPEIKDSVLRKILKKKVPFPDDINFTGDVRIKATGSPDVNSMDLSLVSSLKNIKVFTEDFIDGKLSLKGFKGDWKIEEAILIDQERSVFATGSLNGIKTMDINVESPSYESSRINLLTDLGINLMGPVTFSLNAKGPIEGPKATGTLFSSNLNGSFRKMGKVKVDYRLYQDGLSWEGEIFNKSVVGSGYLPFDSDQSFSFDGALKDLDLINILSIAKDSSKKPLSWVSSEIVGLKTKNLQTGVLRGLIKNTSIRFESNRVKRLRIYQKNKVDSLEKTLNFRVSQNQIIKSEIDLFFRNTQNLSFAKKGVLNLDFLEPFIPGTEQFDGVLESDFKIKTVNNVTKGEGASFIKGLTYRNTSFPYTFNSGSSRIDWYADHARFSKASAFLNGAQIKGSGRVTYDPSFFVDFAFKYDNLTLELPEKITSTSNGNLIIRGSKIPLKLSGEVNVNNGVFALNLLNNNSTESVQPSYLLPQAVLKEDSSPFDLNLDINLVRPYEISNAEAKGYASGNFNIHGLTSNPRMTGRINLLKGTKLLFQDKQFVLNEGLITYNNKPPENPRIFIDAESKLIDKNSLVNAEYDVRVVLKGTGSNPEAEFSSQPGLDENQIISLITIGTASTQTLDQEIGEDQKATQSGLQVGSYLLQQNAAIKDFQNQTGTEIEISSSVDSGGVNPKVGINKSWTPKFSSNLSQTFGNQKQISLDNKFKINKNLSTVIKVQNSRTDDASLIINRRIPDGNIFGLDLEYNVEFE